MKLVYTCLLMLLVSTLCLGVPKPKSAAVRYHVPKPTQLTFHSPKKLIYSIITDVKSTDKSITSEVLDTEEGFDRSIKSWYAANDDGLWLTKIEGSDLATPVMLAPSSITKGSKWATQYIGLRGVLSPAKATCTSIEDISLEAGKFAAAKVELEIVGVEPSTATLWYVEGIGVVKEVRDGQLIKELAKIQPLP